MRRHVSPTKPQVIFYKHNTTSLCTVLQVYGHYGNVPFTRLASLSLYYIILSPNVCQNTADGTALVHRDYIPELAATVDHFAGS